MKQLKFGLVVAACLGLVVAGTAANQFSLVGPALADKGGNGNGGNGNGGGHGNGGGSGKGNSGNHGKLSGHGKSASAHDKTKVQHDKSKAQKALKPSVDVEDDVVVDEIDDNTLGPLNAAHASARARERAASNSSVGKIATYERSREAALALTDPVLREQALDDSVAQLESDFGRTLTDDQIDQVNALLDARQ
ncbi:Holotricin-3 precursor [Phyllobacterium sp. LjRoot231]|uniref:Holotricin-3 precursor n=1 Tax=Phyllobacterium sp. LjRoot231 TaxID=3342289 RepID=UPI003ECD5B9C